MINTLLPFRGAATQVKLLRMVTAQVMPERYLASKMGSGHSSKREARSASRYSSSLIFAATVKL
jgi:hypothetical protein